MNNKLSNFKPIRQSRISEEVLDRMKDAILIGDFKIGERLPSERDLADQFQVSRLAVREALRALENSGFLITRKGAAGGAYVTDLTFEQLGNALLDLFLAQKISVPEHHQVRILIEPEVARLAAINIDRQSGERLQKALEAEAPLGIPLREAVHRGTKVHLILAEMCGNRFLEAIASSLLKLNMKIVQLINPNPDDLHPPGMHQPIVEAVLAGDSEAAAEAMRKHAIEFGQNLGKIEEEYRKRIGLHSSP
jgi:GntR family transcriptional repressor for pyruvate dehydrogenase complex